MPRQTRTAIFMSCSKQESATVHAEAEAQRRPVNSYVLNIVMRNVDTMDKISQGYRLLNLPIKKNPTPHPRTGCSFDVQMRSLTE